MPSIPGGDSGELVAESCELGTAHPPGYPLYTILVHIISIMPPSITFNTSVAYRANLFCAFLSALASSLITSTVYSLKFYGLVASAPQVGRKTTSNDKSHNEDVLSAANDSVSTHLVVYVLGHFMAFPRWSGLMPWVVKFLQK